MVFRTTSSEFRSAFYSPFTGEALLGLVEVSHADLDETMRFVNDDADITLSSSEGGYIYTASKFSIGIPSNKEGEIPESTIVVQNVDQSIAAAIRSITSAPQIAFRWVLLSDPDTTQAGPWTMTLRHVRGDAFIVTGRIAMPNIWMEPYPKDLMDPKNFPNLF